MALHPDFPQSPHEIIDPTVHDETTATGARLKQATIR